MPETEKKLILPFDTSHDVSVIQGFNGPYSHFDYSDLPKGKRRLYDLSYAIDFSLPFGSIVRAARGGVVDSFIDSFHDFYEGDDFGVAVFSPANFLVIRCPDGTFDVYSHLQNKSVFVKEGNPVFPGQEIAKTGRSGWVGYHPHLHFHSAINEGFQLQNGVRVKIMRTIPISFQGYDEPLFHQYE